MDKQNIIDLLEEKHNDLFTWMDENPDEKWLEGPDGKWTTGQHVAHLVDVMKRVNHAMSFPKFMLKYKFGKSNREVRAYDDMVKRYQTKLAKAEDKAKEFNAHIKAPTLKERKKMLTTLKIQNKKLQHKTKRWKDKDLDNLILPHPLMGKMPIREIVMFMGYHTEHHMNILREKH